MKASEVTVRLWQPAPLLSLSFFSPHLAPTGTADPLTSPTDICQMPAIPAISQLAEQAAGPLILSLCLPRPPHPVGMSGEAPLVFLASSH